MVRKLVGGLGAIALIGLSVYGGFYLYQYHSSGRQLPPSSEVSHLQDKEVTVIGAPRPRFALPDLSGQTRDINEWDGKVLVINFWATWCPPCLKEIPEFVALQKKYAGEGLQFIGIALQDPREVVEFAREHAMNYPVLAGEGGVIPVAESYGNTVGVLPYTAIVDRDGLIRYTRAGPLPGAELETLILPLL